jgi:hypothetical protein
MFRMSAPARTASPRVKRAEGPEVYLVLDDQSCKPLQ